MRWLQVLRSLFSVTADDLPLARSQLAALSGQTLIMYGILVINTVTLAVTHMGVAPVLLTVVAPAVLCGGCVLRVIAWRRAGPPSQVSAEEAVRRLRAKVRITALGALAFLSWTFSLYPYADVYLRAHIAFSLGVTAITCLFCLTHLRAAVLLLTILSDAGFVTFFCLTGHAGFVAIAINFLLVSGAMLFVLLRNYADFAALITSQQELLARQVETQRLSDENFRLANLDSLTGLPNRRSFLADLGSVLQAAERDGKAFAAALIDIDGFQSINEAHGHLAGDRLLAEVGQRLAGIAGPNVLVARLGGDEFGAILAGDPSESDIRDFGQQIRNLLRGRYLLPDIEAEVTGSSGLATYPKNGRSVRQLFERADYALRHAKQARRGEAVIFSQEHETMIREAARLTQALRHADFEREMFVVFQPLVDATSGRTLGFEALARWDSPHLGTVSPGVFIPLAERVGLIGQLTETLLVKTLQAAASWDAPLRVSFNLSAHDLTSPATAEAVRRIIAESGVAPQRIDLEITETAMLRDFGQAIAALTSLRALGACISLDDFGTGFSSLSHVQRLKPDKIKIDRSFVTEVETSRTSRDIVRTIVDLCRNLDFGCVVEGVETDTQKRALAGLGCRIMQGYLFGRPVVAEEAARHVAAQEHAAALRNIAVAL